MNFHLPTTLSRKKESHVHQLCSRALLSLAARHKSIRKWKGGWLPLLCTVQYRARWGGCMYTSVVYSTRLKPADIPSTLIDCKASQKTILTKWQHYVRVCIMYTTMFVWYHENPFEPKSNYHRASHPPEEEKKEDSHFDTTGLLLLVVLFWLGLHNSIFCTQYELLFFLNKEWLVLILLGDLGGGGGCYEMMNAKKLPLSNNNAYSMHTTANNTPMGALMCTDLSARGG